MGNGSFKVGVKEDGRVREEEALKHLKFGRIATIELKRANWEIRGKYPAMLWLVFLVTENH